MATVKNLIDFYEKELIFIDANIFLFHAFQTNENATEFLKKIENGEVNGITASLIIDKIFFKLLTYEASKYVEKTTISNIKRFLKKDKERRREIMDKVKCYGDYIMGMVESGLRIVEVTSKYIFSAINYCQIYGLLPRDAVYMAIMEERNIRYIASDDNDFNEIKEITVWKP